ncbi:MAG: ABC transporter permease subunit [Anaerolineales bacterium]|nr:ABC transporter permease subunit [Anaerolineales bacterium]
MMTIWNVAWKDLVRSARSVFILVFALVLPLLTTGVFFAAFGGLSSGDESPSIPAPRVLVVNLDSSGEAAIALENVLTGDELSNVLDAARESDPAPARLAVDTGGAAVAVIIPLGFSAGIGDPESAAGVEVYQDPAQTVGPAIVRSILEQALDGFAGGWVVIKASGGALASRSVMMDGATAARISALYTEWAPAQLAAGAGGLAVESTAGAKRESVDFMARMISAIMAMMLVFYCFFTGTASAQSILTEQEEGTLPRLFTMPVRRSQILGGKMLSVFLTLAVQLIVLLAVSALVFGIRWGDSLSVVLAVIGTGTLSASFAIFITSFLKNTKQAGMVYGVVVNLVGWIGISRLFAEIIPGLSKYSAYTDTVSLVSPQGWAARIWQESMAGTPVWFTLAGMLALSLVLFGIGVFKFNRRFSE